MGNPDMANDTKTGQLMAFRADSETLRMIKRLEQSDPKKSKTNLITQAIHSSYNILLLEDYFESIKTVIKTVFKESKPQRCLPPWDFFVPNTLEEEKISIKNDEIIVIFGLPEFKVDDKHGFFLPLDQLHVELSVKNKDYVEVNFEMPILDISIEKLDSSILKKVYEIASKENIKIESFLSSKKETLILYKLEHRLYYNEQDWKTEMEKDLKKLKVALEELKQFKHNSKMS